MSREVNLGEVEVEVTWREPTVTSDVGAFLIFRSHESGDEFAVGETFVRYIFSDIEGRSAECEFTITVEAVDDKIPNIRNCPDDFTASYQIGSDSATATWVEPTASDDSGYAYLHSKTNEPGSIFHLWTFMHSVTYTFSDAANNIALCTFFITFEPVDTEAPIVHDCPQVVEVEVEQRENGSFVRWDGPNVEDNSGSYDVILETDLQKGSFFPIGLTHVAVSFVDPAGHKSECTTDVIVSRVDRLQPLVHDCPGDIIWGISNEEERANVYWDEPTASDNSGQVVLSFRSHNPGQFFTLDGSSKEVKYIFQDSSRNEALCKFRVSVEIDEIPPQIVGCPGNMERTIPSNNNDVYIDWEDPIAEDNTYHVSLVHQSHHGGDLFYEGETEVTYIFQDSAGNENLCSFLITVHKGTTFLT
ncbi:Hyalin [Holothuria leucospilota]|uniref:Hyalin n=1 Tax=Holothuria leucospilota TaxID=206669 RepID=A0A9Q1HI56_HOLLE|nr:Hyalin [Holothuria leucospilota]